MELGISNIAWSPQDDGAAHKLLQTAGVSLLELAPTRQWPDLSGVPAAQARALHDDLAKFNLRPVAFQAIFFGKPQFQILDEEPNGPSQQYLQGVFELAANLGVKAVVFGSPKNRRRGHRNHDEAMERAVQFFQIAGKNATQRGVCLCIEPNPKEYDCDFMTTMAEAAEVVQAVNSPGIRLQGDGGELIMNQEDVEKVLKQYGSLLGHFHISEPLLGSFGAPKGDHRRIGQALRAGGYDGIVSIEMRAQPAGLPAVAEALNFARDHYLC